MTLSASFALPWFVTDNCGRMATLSKYTAKVKIRSEEINHNKEWKIILTWEFLYLHVHEVFVVIHTFLFKPVKIFDMLASK